MVKFADGSVIDHSFDYMNDPKNFRYVKSYRKPLTRERLEKIGQYLMARRIRQCLQKKS